MIGTFAPPLAAAIDLIAGAVTPRYDPIARTVSRLAVPGAPAALATDVAIALAGLACLAVAAQVRTARVSLVMAGAGFLAAAAIHLDPDSAVATWSHRAASAIAVAGVTVAPLASWRRYGRVLLVSGIAEVAMLLLALVLLATPFNGWGAWERVLLFLALSNLVILARTIPSSDEAASARAATQSRGATYEPVPSVNRANP